MLSVYSVTDGGSSPSLFYGLGNYFFPRKDTDLHKWRPLHSTHQTLVNSCTSFGRGGGRMWNVLNLEGL